jgi:hypothetical protein
MLKIMVNAQAKARSENNPIQPCSPEGKPEKDRHACLKKYKNRKHGTKVHRREKCNTAKSLYQVSRDIKSEV